LLSRSGQPDLPFEAGREHWLQVTQETNGGVHRLAKLPTPEAEMKFMIFVKSNPGLEKSIDAMSASTLKESMAKMNAFNEELKKAGVMKDCDGLRPSREGKRVRFDGQSRSVVDGPFEGDLVAGYWIWELPGIEDAVAWVKRCPNPMPAPSEIEIRPI
jgi:hypothetical protein